MKRHVKSADTKTPVSASQTALQNILRRYGASGFGFNSDYRARLIRVTFRVPDQPGSPTIVPVQLEISIEAIARALFPQSKALAPWAWEQAERVAWRHLVLWVDAACSATNAGLQSMSEAFLAHALVKAPDGTIKRVIAMLDDAAGDGGYRALLPSGIPG